MILPTALIDDIKNSLRVNASNIIPSRFELTNEGFMILGFKPNCKYVRILCRMKIYMVSRDQRDLLYVKSRL